MKHPQWVYDALKEAGEYVRAGRESFLNEFSVNLGQSPEFNAYEWDGRVMLARTVGLKRAYAARLRSNITDLAAWVKESEARVNDCLRKMVEEKE